MKHILMVDDSTTNLKSAAEVLQPFYQLSMAKSGKQALQFLKRSIPDLILLDLMMPEMDGYAVMEQIKLNPLTAGIPIIFLTADSEQASERKGLQMGAMDFITKPFKAEAMLGRIEKVLQMEDMRKNLLVETKGELQQGKSLSATAADNSFSENAPKKSLSEKPAERQQYTMEEVWDAVHKVDHTLLKAYASWEEIEKLCEEAIEYQTASVCVPPSYIARIRETYGGRLKICTVIGFPLGYATTAVKVFETQDAVKNGADEIDMVVNIGDVKNGSYDLIEREIGAVRAACQGKILKVIVETCYLTEEEKIRLCGIVTKAGADYIKTSTGFGTSGAKEEDIVLFREHIGRDVKIKAAGGIRTKDALMSFAELGCDRIGASATADFVK